MGYMGFGMRQWISNMKPKPYFSRRNDPVADHKENITGHHVQDYYHLNQNKLENLIHRKSDPVYLKSLQKKMKQESKKQMILGLLLIVLFLAILTAAFVYMVKRFDLF